MDDTIFQSMIKAQERFHPKAMNIPGVFATSIARKVVAGAGSEDLAICIHVRRKKSLDALAAAERIPATIDGFATDVVEGTQMVRATDTTKYRPMLGGCQIGVGEKFGTIGCFVTDNTDKTTCALSNEHVLGSKGWTTYQPASGVVCDEIGSTKRSVNNATVDCGISTLTAYNDSGLAEILNIGNVKGTRSVDWRDYGITVLKRGAKTLLTRGTISGLNYMGLAEDGIPVSGQITIAPLGDQDFLDHGDSGSVVVDQQNNIVGLLMGYLDNNSKYKNGVANRIENVLAALNVTVMVAKTLSEARPARSTLPQGVEALLCRSVKGRAYWDTYVRYGSQWRHLLFRNPRLYAAWLSMPQQALVDVVRQAGADPDSRIPSTIGGTGTAELLGELRGVLAKHLCSDDVRRQIDAFCDDVVRNIGVSWREALADVTAARISAPSASIASTLKSVAQRRKTQARLRRAKTHAVVASHAGKKGGARGRSNGHPGRTR